jgi:hypothetical protein
MPDYASLVLQPQVASATVFNTDGASSLGIYPSEVRDVFELINVARNFDPRQASRFDVGSEKLKRKCLAAIGYIAVADPRSAYEGFRQAHRA